MTNPEQKIGQKKELGWKELPRGGVVLDTGSARDYETGDWRSFRPLWSKEKCIQCLRCWVFCPDAAIIVEDGKMVGIDYKHCKGCGICRAECPAKENAFEMVSEADIEED